MYLISCFVYTWSCLVRLGGFGKAAKTITTFTVVFMSRQLKALPACMTCVSLVHVECAINSQSVYIVRLRENGYVISTYINFYGQFYNFVG